MVPRFNDIKANNDLSRFIYCRFSPLLLLPSADGIANARMSFIYQAENLLDNNSDGLPDLDLAPGSRTGEKHFAEVIKAFDETSMIDNGLDTDGQTKQFAFGQACDMINKQVNQQLESWFSPWGNASVGLRVGSEDSFIGGWGSRFIPWQDNPRYLTWSQLGLAQQSKDLVSNAGVEQRRVRDGWFLGYNIFYDDPLDENLPWGSLSAKTWGEYLYLSANHYQPLPSWQGRSAAQEQRMARGYDLTAQMYIPFYQHLSIGVNVEQHFGNQMDLFHSGTGHRNPVAVNLGLSHTPVSLITIMAQYKQGEGGISQNSLGLALNYRFGIPPKK